MNPLIPMALFGVVVAVVVFAMWEPGPNLEGELAGVELEEFTIPPAVIDKTSADLPAGEVDSDLKEMQNDPPQGIRIPDWFEMQFHPEPGGLKVAIEKTTVTEVFRVNTGTKPAIREFFNQHKAEILKRQQAEFRPALKKFFKDWESFHKANAPFETEAYRGSLGFNALGGPLGVLRGSQGGAAGLSLRPSRRERGFVFPSAETHEDLRASRPKVTGRSEAVPRPLHREDSRSQSRSGAGGRTRNERTPTRRAKGWNRPPPQPKTKPPGEG